jgi:hypothetical protein
MQTQILLETEMGAVGHGTQHLTAELSFARYDRILKKATIHHKSRLNALNELERSTSLKSCQELSFVILPLNICSCLDQET